MLSTEIRTGIWMTCKSPTCHHIVVFSCLSHCELLFITVILKKIFSSPFIGLIKMIYSLPEVKHENLTFLSNNIYQDPLEKFWMSMTERRDK